MKECNEAFVYMLTNDRGNVLYIGCTTDLRERIYFHKHKIIGGFTKKYNVYRLVYFECYPTMDEARKRERQLKGKNRAKKEQLIRSVNPAFVDLTAKLF
jgi:putative endonuclease